MIGLGDPAEVEERRSEHRAVANHPDRAGALGDEQAASVAGRAGRVRGLREVADLDELGRRLSRRGEREPGEDQ
jgi:hypothetical protein